MTKRTRIAAGALAAALLLFALAAAYRVLHHRGTAGANASALAADDEEAHSSLLYGRVATVDGASFEGRLRWGRGEEAFWGDYFNGAKKRNPWAAYVAPERLPKESYAVKIFGLEVSQRERALSLDRLFMARFGDIARIEAQGREVRVVWKSGAAVDLNRFEASDFDDGVRVWDDRRGVTDLDSTRIRSIEFLPAPASGAAPGRLHGTVRARSGVFTGFVQWDREQSLGSDELRGGEVRLRFDTIRAIARRSAESAAVSLADGRQIELAAAAARGVYVDDVRYGRVLVSWDAFERIDFTPGGAAPAYTDFPAGGPLTGGVLTRDGRRLEGRLVYDLDESEITETLDAPSRGVDYTLPFGLIASIQLDGPDESGARRAAVTLHSGEELALDGAGDLGAGNAGMLIFQAGSQRPAYVPWRELTRIELSRPSAMCPPARGR